jgi:hypothetical protein
MANSGFRTFGLLREHTIDTPTITPVATNVNTTTALTITSSAFFVYLQSPSDVYTNWGAVTHISSEWEVSSDSTFSIIPAIYHVTSTSSLLSATIPAHTFSGGTTYYARVKYNSYAELNSSWSGSNVSFTAQSPYVVTPNITSPANGTVLYVPNGSFTLYGSAYTDPHQMSTFVSADWIVVNPGATQTLWSNYGNTTPPTSGISIPLSNTYPTVIYVAVRYHGTNGAISQWSYAPNVAPNIWVGYNIEYCIPTSPNLSTSVFKVNMAPVFVNGIWYDWSNWMNTNAVWVSPGGEQSTYIADYMPITIPLTLPVIPPPNSNTNTYYFNYMWDNAGQIVINGGGYVNYILVNFDFVNYGCNFQNGNNMPIGSPCVTPLSLTGGVQYLITVTGYNAPNQVPPGSTLTYAEVNDWSSNPAGMCLVINGPNQNPSANYSNVSGVTVFNLVWYVGQTAPYCASGTYYNGECHCFTP